MSSNYGSRVIGELSSFISTSGDINLPNNVIIATKHHILDTLVSIVYGSKLKPGLAAKNFAENQKGVEEAQVIGTPIITSAINAAMVNGIMAHADETDDFDPRYRIHPGASIVPAALAMAEREKASGMNFLKGVVAGYDIACRIIRSLGADSLTKAGRSTHSVGNVFGAAVAAASILKLEPESVRYVLSYTAQQASGTLYWARDEEHIEKGFLFGGMPARNGVTAAIFGQLGFTGVRDAFSGENNFFTCSSPDSKPELLLKGLGSQFEIMNVYIKKFPVGGPIQAAIDALLLLIKKHGIKASDVQRISVNVPSSRVVDDRDMPDINLQYLLSTVLIKGKLTIEDAHSFKRMHLPEITELKKRITLTDDPGLSTSGAMRQAKVEIVTVKGYSFSELVTQVRGSPQNPMTTEEIEDKSLDLLIPILGEMRSHELIERVMNLEQIRSMRELRLLLSIS
jgi:2-methylcitrate dehydratase PrpD